MRPIEPIRAAQFRIPHSALRIRGCFSPSVPLGRGANHCSTPCRRVDLAACDVDHHKVVAELIHTATVGPATTDRPGARLLRRHGVVSTPLGAGRSTRKSRDGIELMQV